MANPFISQGMDMQNPEAVQIMRRQKMAEQLLSQGQEPLQGQMVSGHYVAPSWTQQLAKGLNTYMGYKGLKESDEAQKALAETLRGKRQEDLSKFAELLGGRPEGNAPVDGVGPVQPAQAPNPGEAYKYAVGSQTPELQQFGMQGMLTQAQAQMQQQQAEQTRLKAAAMWQAAGGDPQKALAMGMPADVVKQFAEAPNFGKEKGVVVGNQIVNPMTGELIGKPIAKPADMSNDLLIPDDKGGFVVNQPLLRAKQQVAAASRAPAAERQAQIIQTDSGPMQLVGGQAVPIVGPDGKAVRGATAGAGGAKPLTEGQAKGSLFLGQMRSATGELDKLPNVSPIATSMTGNTMTNWAAGKDAQKVAQLQNQWAEAYLRAKTGAAATPGEVNGNIRTFFPVVGDTPEVIAQKKQMRRQAEQDMVPTAGHGAATAGMPVAMPERAVSPQDAQAMEWARSNPNDPRSKTILQRLGGQ